MKPIIDQACVFSPEAVCQHPCGGVGRGRECAGDDGEGRGQHQRGG